MHDRSLPLIFATAAFLAVLLWRVRPVLSWRQHRESRDALRHARARIESAADVARVAADLSRRPRKLEAILWRHLAAVPWTGESEEAARASLEALRALYQGRLKNGVRARALGHALEAIGQPGGQNTVGSA
jgi:hypothetical protein